MSGRGRETLPLVSVIGETCGGCQVSSATSLRFEESPDADPHGRWCGAGLGVIGGAIPVHC